MSIFSGLKKAGKKLISLTKRTLNGKTSEKVGVAHTVVGNEMKCAKRDSAALETSRQQWDALPQVVGNCDYDRQCSELKQIDELLNSGGVEAEYIDQRLQVEQKAHREKTGKDISSRRQKSLMRRYEQGLRCSIARLIFRDSFREFSKRTAESPSLRIFCRIPEGEKIRSISKTTLNDMEHAATQDLLQKLNVTLIKTASMVDNESKSIINLIEPVDLSVVLTDTTCIELMIHVPVDWVLFRDFTVGIMDKIEIIRRLGLLHRMRSPNVYKRMINAKCMAMSAAGRRYCDDGKKRRKGILREMKRFCKKVAAHGARYRDMLKNRWRYTEMSEAQAQRIIEGIDRLLQLLPQAIDQAHERIIGERAVPNGKKLLSLHESHAQVYTRHKHGSEKEFGLQLHMTELTNGMIIDVELTEGRVANDTTLLVPATNRIIDNYGDGTLKFLSGDRGFCSKANSKYLSKKKIKDATLPRNVTELQKKLADPEIRKLNQRRAQTEARISIFKWLFLGGRLRSKGFESQKRTVAWAMLAHNLWVLGRKKYSPELAENAA